MAQMCSTCGLPQELCVCEDVSKDQMQVSVSTEERSYDKTVTLISGFDPDAIDMSSLASELKSNFACGGTINGDTIELQGDHESGVIQELQNRGYNVA